MRKLTASMFIALILVGAAFADIVVAGNGAVVKETLSSATSTVFTIPGVANICLGAEQECHTSRTWS